MESCGNLQCTPHAILFSHHLHGLHTYCLMISPASRLCKQKSIPSLVSPMSRKKVPPENASASRIFTISPMSRNKPLANLFSEQNTHVPFSEQRAPKGEHNKLQTQDMKGNRRGREIACTAILCQLFPFCS